ncbi:hypothetical protein BS50DRAFT_584339 [Corynespora cassiicola Philippines]|uniref:HMG box domain-containing protein n=1 Tax=Corynespora cassiicola Philippines TaxID=1448308 RepID=A0A2T2NZA4_CORCC|nr:hypothetical protein BS50DRAFT_584339 [Corynespora cassiicola Philippines]
MASPSNVQSEQLLEALNPEMIATRAANSEDAVHKVVNCILPVALQAEKDHPNDPMAFQRAASLAGALLTECTAKGLVTVAGLDRQASLPILDVINGLLGRRLGKLNGAPEVPNPLDAAEPNPIDWPSSIPAHATMLKYFFDVMLKYADAHGPAGIVVHVRDVAAFSNGMALLDNKVRDVWASLVRKLPEHARDNVTTQQMGVSRHVAAAEALLQLNKIGNGLRGFQAPPSVATSQPTISRAVHVVQPLARGQLREPNLGNRSKHLVTRTPGQSPEKKKTKVANKAAVSRTRKPMAPTDIIIPKKPRSNSAWGHFASVEGSRVSAQLVALWRSLYEEHYKVPPNPNHMPTGNVNKYLGAIWQNMRPEERGQWDGLRVKELQRYENRMRRYNAGDTITQLEDWEERDNIRKQAEAIPRPTCTSNLQLNEKFGAVIPGVTKYMGIYKPADTPPPGDQVSIPGLSLQNFLTCQLPVSAPVAVSCPTVPTVPSQYPTIGRDLSQDAGVSAYERPAYRPIAPADTRPSFYGPVPPPKYYGPNSEQPYGKIRPSHLHGSSITVPRVRNNGYAREPTQLDQTTALNQMEDMNNNLGGGLALRAKNNNVPATRIISTSTTSTRRVSDTFDRDFSDGTNATSPPVSRRCNLVGTSRNPITLQGDVLQVVKTRTFSEKENQPPNNVNLDSMELSELNEKLKAQNGNVKLAELNKKAQVVEVWSSVQKLDDSDSNSQGAPKKSLAKTSTVNKDAGAASRYISIAPASSTGTIFSNIDGNGDIKVEPAQSSGRVTIKSLWGPILAAKKKQKFQVGHGNLDKSLRRDCHDDGRDNGGFDGGIMR